MPFRNAASEAGRITFTRASAERIAGAVQIVENQRPAAQPLTFESVMPPPKVFRTATFTGAWSIGATKEIRFRSNTAQTALAVNLMVGLSPSSECECSVAREGTAWHLVEVNLTKQPGYSGSGTQSLTIQNGVLAWGQTASVNIVTGVTLGTSGLVFSTMQVQVDRTVSTALVTIGTTACP